MSSSKPCEIINSNPRIVLSEKRSSITFINAKARPLRIITVDGCAIKTGPRCDYLVIEDRKNAFYVELKGSDIKHAIMQIESSIKHFRSSVNVPQVACYISFHQCPMTSTFIQNNQVRFKKDHSAKLFIMKSPITVNI